MDNYDFEGWATRNNVKCSDGRTIRKNAFQHNDGQTVPLVWNHQHNENQNVLGHVLLENREEGVYAYGKFNETESGQNAKLLVENGDVNQLSIYANQLKQQNGDVFHGTIREVSLVLAGANPEATIENVIKHNDGGDPYVCDEEAHIFSGEEIAICHSEGGEQKKDEGGNGKTIEQIINEMTDEQRDVLYAMVGMAMEESNKSNSKGDNEMKHNVFEGENRQSATLTHSAINEVLGMAMGPGGTGSFRAALDLFMEDNELKHADGEYAQLFDPEDIDNPDKDLLPDYVDARPGGPMLLERDQTWVGHVMRGVHKSPISRIRTRYFDVRDEDIIAHGYAGRGTKKEISAAMTILKRTTDPQTVYRKDTLHRDDIIDLESNNGFDVVGYQWGIMQKNLNEGIARAILIGDGRDEGDEMKISQNHIRSIWEDDEMYTIHKDVDLAEAKKELQGTDTGANFGENYIYAEAIITAALYAREKYKGSGSLELYCTPHLLNVMLLARDLNGRRIYSSKTDLAAALNVVAIHTVEQFENKVRTDKDAKKHKLLGMFVNLDDYQVGSTKGGQVTRFDQFDIDFNQYKYLIETRLSGALVKPWSAIVLEEPVVEAED
jgi:HK97 family phage prohead protease